MTTPNTTLKDAATIARAANRVIARHGKNPSDPHEARLANLARHALKAARGLNPDLPFATAPKTALEATQAV